MVLFIDVRRNSITRVFLITLSLLATLSAPLVGCSKPREQGRQVADTVPQFVKDLVKEAPKDALVGIGTARMATLPMSRNTATARARAEISRQLNSIVQVVVQEYPDGSMEEFTRIISSSTLTGSAVLGEDMDEAGHYWVVVIMEKNAAVDEITRADPALAAIDVRSQIDGALGAALLADIGYAGQ